MVATVKAGTSTTDTPTATVTFTLSIDDGGTDVTSYTVDAIEKATSNVVNTLSVSGSTPTLPITMNSGLVFGTQYVFTVTATNAAGASPLSTSNVIIPYTVPAPPTSVYGVAGNKQVYISFLPPTFTGGAPITSYIVSTASGAVAITTNKTVTVTGLTNGTPYIFVVTTKNLLNLSSAPSAVSNTVTPMAVPDAPTNVTVTAGGNAQATIQFTPTPSANNGGSAITKYTVTSNPASSSIDTSPSSPTVVMTGLVNGTSYTFNVTATNAIGTSTFSNPSNAVVPYTTPTIPTNVQVLASGSSVIVSWAAPSSNGGSAITGYLVKLSSSSYSTYPPTPTSVIINGVTAGTYTLSVTAINAAGSSPTAMASPVTVTNVPQPPTNASAKLSGSTAAVSWSAPTDNGGSAITGYRAQMNGGSWTTVGASTLSTSFSGATSSSTYAIQAQNAVGWSVSQTTVPTTVVATVPNPPTNMQVYAPSNASITITYSAPANNGGSAITGYRAQADSKGWTTPTTALKITNIPGASNTSNFEVQAQNAYGWSYSQTTYTFTTATPPN